MSREAIATNDAPGAIGPYSQAIRAGGFIFLSGQVALDPASGNMLEGDVSQQTERVFKNLEAVLKAAGSSLSAAVKATVFLADFNDFAAMNAVYQKFFPQGAPPARSTVEVSKLPRGAKVEIDLIALG